MAEGFLGYRTSFMLDVVVTALVLIVPVQVYSILIVKRQRKWALHRTLQLILGTVLLLAVTAFEIDLQLVHGGWENIVSRSRGEAWLSGADYRLTRNILWVHLIFAVTTPFFWATTIILALRRFPSPPQPGPHSQRHKQLAWISTVDLVLTSVTGLTFYYFAFVR